MSKNMGIIIGLLVLVVVIGGVYASVNKKEKNLSANVDMEQKVMGEEKKDDEKAMMDKSEATMMKVGSYEAYSVEKIARAETGDVVLFFHASWCPSCRGLNSSIESNLKSIPENVSILKTDYDKETELKKKYGVTYQHTLVQVDEDGNMIKKWSGSSSLDNLLTQVQ